MFASFSGLMSFVFIGLGKRKQTPGWQRWSPDFPEHSDVFDDLMKRNGENVSCEQLVFIVTTLIDSDV